MAAIDVRLGSTLADGIQWANSRGHSMNGDFVPRCDNCNQTLHEIAEADRRGGAKTCWEKQKTTPLPKPVSVYVSGPLTTGMLTGNVRRALEIGRILIDRGYVAVVPHEKIVTEILFPMSYDQWLDYDFRVILTCDVVLRIEGESPGGDKEVKFARENGIPVVFSLDTLYACHPATRRSVH